jgi:hypothetical protein
MERFALPEGGVTISGDLMQRVTETGLREWSDMDTICRAYKRCELNVSYRQTERLFKIARDLYKHVTGIEPAFKSAYPSRPEDPPALSFKSTKVATPEWVVDRVCEIFALGNNHLPTTAILVPTPADVEPLKTALHSLLRAMCPSGTSISRVSRCAHGATPVYGGFPAGSRPMARAKRMLRAKSTASRRG